MVLPPTLHSVESLIGPLIARLVPVPAEMLPPEAAIGALSAEQVSVSGPVPPRALARRAGFAVHSAELLGASAYEPAFLASPPVPVAPGQPLPQGCDAVLPADAMRDEGGMPAAIAPAFPGENARLAGSDLAAGRVLIPEGMRITPRHALAARQAGIAALPVRAPRLRIAFSEEPDQALTLLMLDLAGLLGARLAADDAIPALEILLRQGEAPHVAINGGIDADLASDAAPVIRLALGARFDDALSGFLALGMPLLARLAGAEPPVLHLPLAEKVTSAIGMSETVLLAREGERLRPLATGTMPLEALLVADAVMLVPAMLEGYPAGALVSALPLSR